MSVSLRARTDLRPLEPLFERPGLASFDLPEELAAVYGGDPHHPGLGERALALTSEQGAARLGRHLPRSAAIAPIGDQPPLDPAVAVETLRAGGHELILCEGGPLLFGALVDAGLVDELFLTLSPVLAGRGHAGTRLSLLEGAELLPDRTPTATLLTLRRADSHLFLRYHLSPGEASKSWL